MARFVAGLELSVVIPALDEAVALPRLIEALRKQEGVALEVIVADGGSRDDSVAAAEAAGARVVQARRGRGAQMNAGAAQARAPELLFLHADSELESPTLLRDALGALRAARLGSQRVAGHFPLRFVREVEGHEGFFRHLEEKTATNRPDTINGDQGTLLSAAYFRDLGGFDERLPFLEDQRLAARIFATGRWIVLPGRLATSARRFETEGHTRRYTLMGIIMGMHAAGVDAFFERARGVYAAQGEADRLSVRPYLTVVRQILREAGPTGAAAISLRVGRYVRSQSWQLFFGLDVWLRRWLGPGRYPFLWLHERVFRPLTANPVADAITAVLVPIWFVIVLPIGYSVSDWLRARVRSRSGSPDRRA